MRLILIWVLLGVIIPTMVYGGSEPFITEEVDIGKVYLLNIKERNINKQCLMEKVRLIISYIDNQQVAPYLVKIWKEHTIVKDILKQETIRIERELSKSDILIPIKHKGYRIILYRNDGKNESYGMYGIISDKLKVDFYECFK